VEIRPSPFGRLVLLAGAALLLGGPARPSDFVHYESSHVHPIALSPAGDLLYAVNTPESRLAIFEVADTGSLAFRGDVPVGLEPVSLAVRPGTHEVWVANHLSDSVSVVDAAAGRLVATLAVGDEPTDVAFASGRAFVSLAGKEDRVAVYDAASRQRIATLEIFGDDPRALAVTPDGTRVALVVLESGNGTTSVHPAGMNGRPLPPPDPPRDPIFPPAVPPQPAPNNNLIVQHDPASDRWLDDTGDDWSDAVFLGAGFTLPDYDLFWIDATADPPVVVSRVSGLGTLLFDVSIHPTSGAPWVPNTEARNLIRFEPNLRGHLVETRVSIVDPDGGDVRTVDLNPHIDRSRTPGPPEEIALSVATPGDGLFTADGATYYLSAFGSAKVAVLDGWTGSVVERIAVGGGPSGLALLESARRLYVMQRFDNTIAIVDTERNVQVGSIGVAGPFAFDPSPPEVREGRRFLYDAALSSGHGDISCATCHVFANFDGLAWNLGDPRGAFVAFADAPWADPDSPHAGWDPMKGPMVTQTLRGLRGTEPFHWRGDRPDFQSFNGAFVTLLGRGAPLSEAEMDAFAAFARTVELPPNPYRELDDSLPASIEGQGDAVHGGLLFQTVTLLPASMHCTSCHRLPLGTNLQIQPIGDRDLKVPHLRNVYEKLNLDRFDSGPEPTLHRKGGFGIFSHGAFQLDLFLALTLPQEMVTDVRAFLISFPTPTPPCVGHQQTLGAGAAEAAIEEIVSQADLGRCDLIAKGVADGVAVGYAYEPEQGVFTPDAARDAAPSPAEMLSVLGQQDLLTFTGVPAGSGRRLGVDRDRDGCLDGDELRQHSDPAHPGTPLPDSDEDGLPDETDLCPGWVQHDHAQTDSDGDGTPDECTCGDVSNDGRVDLRDVILLARYLAGRTLPAVVVGKCNVAGPAGNDPELCDRDDLRALLRAVTHRFRGGFESDMERRCLPDGPPRLPILSVCVDVAAGS